MIPTGRRRIRFDDSRGTKVKSECPLFAGKKPEADRCRKEKTSGAGLGLLDELQFAKDGKVEVDEQRVRNVQQRNMNNAALRLAEVRGELGLLADDTPERLNEDMVKEDQGASRYDNKDSEASDIAENIRQQMSSTWRVRGNIKRSVKSSPLV